MFGGEKGRAERREEIAGIERGGGVEGLHA